MSSFPERIAALEERVANIKNKLDEVSERVDEIYVLIQRGKGAKWAVITIASIVSGLMGVFAHKILPF